MKIVILVMIRVSIALTVIVKHHMIASIDKKKI